MTKLNAAQAPPRSQPLVKSTGGPTAIHLLFDRNNGQLNGDNDTTWTGRETDAVAALDNQIDWRPEKSTDPFATSVSITLRPFRGLSDDASTWLSTRIQSAERRQSQTDMSVYQARWLLIPIFTLAIAIMFLQAL